MNKGGQTLVRILCALMALAWAMNGKAESVFENAARVIWPVEEAGAWTLTLGAQVEAYPPFGERRIEQLNQMIGHITLRITKDGETADIRMLIDDKETSAEIRVETDRLIAGTETESAGDAENAEHTEKADEDESAEKTDAGDATFPEPEAADRMHDVFQMLDAGASFLSKLPEAYPEGSAEKKIKQKLKTGVATRSVTVTIQATDEGVHPLTKILQENGDELIQEKYGTWEFRGRQRFTLLYAEDGDLLKASYSGRAGETAETLRNISLEWRLKRSDNEKRDEVTLKTPAVDGSSRDNWIVSRVWTNNAGAEDESVEKQPESLSFSFEYDRKHGNSKVAYKWEGSLEGGEGLSGGITYTRKAKNKTETLTVRPEWFVCERDRVDGTLEVIRVSDKVIQEHAKLKMKWQSGSGSSAAEDIQTGILVNMAEEIPESVQREALSSILTMIPEEDLGYLKDEIPEDAWKVIMEAAGK